MMKKILSVLVVISVVAATFVPVAYATTPEDEFVNENVIVNGDFEGASTISGRYDAVIPQCAETSSPWIPFNADFKGVSIGKEEGNEENHVLIFDKLQKNWWGVCQVLPINRKCTGIYNVKFRAKNAGDGKRANLTCRLSFVMKVDGKYSSKNIATYRSVAYGGEETVPSVFRLDDHEWHEYELNVDLMARTSSAAYPDMKDDIVAIELELFQDFDGKSNIDLAHQAGSDLEDTIVYIDDVEVVMPMPLFAREIELEDLQNVEIDGVQIPISFNYTEGIKALYTPEVSIEDNYGNKINCDVSVDDSLLVVTPNGLKPETEYTLTVDKVVSNTPVYDPNKNKAVTNSEKRYVSMIAPQSFSFKTKAMLELIEKSFVKSTGKAVVSLKNNSWSDDAKFILAAFEENDGVITSPVYYSPVTIYSSGMTEVEINDAQFSSNDFKVVILDSFGGQLSTEDAIDIDLLFSAANETLMVSGSADTSLAGHKVTTFVLLPNDDTTMATMESIDATQDGKCEDLFLCINESVVESDGTFVIEPIAVDKTGSYRVICMIDKKVVADENDYFSSKADNDKFLKETNALSGKTAVDGLYELVEQEMQITKVGLDFSYYKNLDLHNKKLVCKELVEQIPFKDIDTFRQAFINSGLVVSAIHTPNADELIKLVADGEYENAKREDVEGLLNLENLRKTSVYKFFEDADEDVKVKICEEFIANVQKHSADAKTADDFAQIFNISAINHRLDNTVLHTSVSAILNDFVDVLDNVNLSKYNALGTNQTSVNKSIKDNRKYNIADFESYVNQLIKDAEKENGKKESGKGSSSVGGGSISSTVPVANTTLAPQPKKYFADVPAEHWASTPVNVLCERGVVSGKSADAFDPDGLVTREEFVKMIVGAAGLELTDDGAMFVDVAQGSWYEPYIKTAHKYKIAQGMGNGAFGVGNNITRQDMFVMCSYLVSDVNVSNGNARTFGDEAQISDYAANSIQKLVSLGVVNGDNLGNINPQNNATRAEAAKVIYDILKLVQKL